MIFTLLMKATANTEAGKPPSKALVDAMTQFHKDLSSAGVLKNAEGLHSSSKGSRVQFDRSGKHSIVKGPFPETSDLVCAFWVLETRSKEEAIDWAKRIPAFSNATDDDFTVEVRQAHSAEDFGGDMPLEVKEQEDRMREAAEKAAAPPPGGENAPQKKRFVVFVKASAESEAGKLPSADYLTAMTAFNQELVNAGMMLAGEGLHATAAGVRIRRSAGGDFELTQGPFAPPQRQVAGFWLIQADSLEDAEAWIARVPVPPEEERSDSGELEIRPVVSATERPT